MYFKLLFVFCRVCYGSNKLDTKLQIKQCRNAPLIRGRLVLFLNTTENAIPRLIAIL